MPKTERRISISVIRRLPRYYRFLYDLKENGVTRISSRELSTKMGLTASQIRQDLNCFGGFGQQGCGYPVEQLYTEIGKIMGMDVLTPAILIGAGRLGRTLATQMKFESKGVKLIGIFDNAPEIIGSQIGNTLVRSTRELETFCLEHKPEMAIMCIPKEAAPDVVNDLIQYGICGFWNFSHFDINFSHPDVVVENVHLGDSLMTLSYRLNQD